MNQNRHSGDSTVINLHVIRQRLVTCGHHNPWWSDFVASLMVILDAVMPCEHLERMIWEAFKNSLLYQDMLIWPAYCVVSPTFFYSLATRAVNLAMFGNNHFIAFSAPHKWNFRWVVNCHPLGFFRIQDGRRVHIEYVKWHSSPHTWGKWMILNSKIMFSSMQNPILWLFNHSGIVLLM